MDRHWLLTWTTYGSWLPGDKRGFVGPFVDDRAAKIRRNENIPGTPVVADVPELEGYARKQLKAAPVSLAKDQAICVERQFRETAAYRGWKLFAVAVMHNHVHIVVGVNGDPEPSNLLRDFKSYASRALNREWATPESGTWWTQSGSKRKLPDESAVAAAIKYVKNQKNPLIVRSWDELGAAESPVG